MYIFIDESIDEQTFVLGAVIVDILLEIVRKFRSEIKDVQKITNDPKENNLHRNFPSFLAKYIDLIVRDFTRRRNPYRNNLWLASSYYKIDGYWNEYKQLQVYKHCFLEIFRLLNKTWPEERLDLCFDTFNKAEGVKNELIVIMQRDYPGCKFTLEHQHGMKRPALFVPDIIAGTMRRFLNETHKRLPIYYPDIKGFSIHGHPLEVYV